MRMGYSSGQRAAGSEKRMRYARLRFSAANCPLI
jgi:hypothetical protein